MLAPRTLFVQVLGPSKWERKDPIFSILALGAIHLGSPDTHGVLVLSPHILSPRIYSEERYLIEVLSPHILGGEHSSEVEEDEHEHFGGAVRFSEFKRNESIEFRFDLWAGQDIHRWEKAKKGKEEGIIIHMEMGIIRMERLNMNTFIKEERMNTFIKEEKLKPDMYMKEGNQKLDTFMKEE